MLGETWAPIPRSEGWYEASDRGRIRSWIVGDRKGKTRREEPHVCTPVANSTGYLCVSVRGKKRLVHQLVLEAFVGPRSPGYEGAHLDGDPHNNELSNLAWVTHTENMRHAVDHGRTTRGERSARAKLTEAQVREIRAMYPRLTHREIGERFGIRAATVCQIVKRQRWAHVEEEAA